MTVDEKIKSIMHAATEDIQGRMDAAGVNASGRTRASIRVRSLGDGECQIVQYGKRFAPIQTIETGRRAGKVPYRFRDILYDWSIDKGIQFDSDRERRTFAFFLAKKIAAEGTPRSGTGNPRPLSIIEPVKRKVRRDVEIATSESLMGYVKANVRYAFETAKVKVSDFFKWG